jgi:hypothetical protein
MAITTSTYGLSMTGEPTQMARTPSASEFNDINPADLAGLTVEQAVELLWGEWEVRWALSIERGAPPRHRGDAPDGVGMLLSHRTEPWWAVASVWTGEVPDLVEAWERRDPIARHWSIGKTIGTSGWESPTAEWASTLTDLIVCTRARMRFESGYPSKVFFPLDEVLDSVPVEVVGDIEAARMLAALRS